MSQIIEEYDKLNNLDEKSYPDISSLNTLKVKRDIPIPVTLLSGFLGAGKTTLLKHILNDHGHKMKIAVVVNDMGSINIDANEIKRHKLVQEKAQMIEFHNGCICCTLRGDLLKTIKNLSEELNEDGNLAWEYIVIESTGISEPLPVAQTFVMDVTSCSPHDENNIDEHFDPLSKYARLDTLVTVTDLYNILHILGGDDTDNERERLIGKEDANDEKPKTSLYNLLVDQLEFANVILLNKVDLIHPEDPIERHKLVMKVTRLVRKFNTEAQILVPGYQYNDNLKVGELTKNMFQDFDVKRIINTNLFDMEKAKISAGWIHELNIALNGIEHTPETEEYGISSFVWKTNFDDPRPFHPIRLQSIFKGFGHLISENEDMKNDVFTGVVRSKGQLWIANCNGFQINFHTAGRQVSLNGGMPFLAAIPQDYWDTDNWEQYSDFKNEGYWHGTPDNGFGDRISTLVFIGLGLTVKRKDLITKALNNALLTEEEMIEGKVAFQKKLKDHPWKSFSDPFFSGGATKLFEITTSNLEE